LLVAMLSGLLMLTGFAYLAGLSSVPLLIATSGAGIFSVAILLAWWGWGRHIISLLTFLFIPVYVVSKIPYYVGFLWKRQKNWVRTDRK
jgi:hypothetical protein